MPLPITILHSWKWEKLWLKWLQKQLTSLCVFSPKLHPNMWCDQAKWVWSQNFFCCFSAFSIRYYLSFNLVKPPWGLGNSFSRYSILSDYKNNRKQRNYLLCLTVTSNYYLRVPTHFAWLHHISVWNEISENLITTFPLWNALSSI